MFIEELGILFKGDPTFDMIKDLPRSLFMKIVELRKKRLIEEPQLSLT